jgi:hypothetical protein
MHIFFGALFGVLIAVLFTRLLEMLPVPPRRFSLRTLLFAMTGAAILFGAFGAAVR